MALGPRSGIGLWGFVTTKGKESRIQTTDQTEERKAIPGFRSLSGMIPERFRSLLLGGVGGADRAVSTRWGVTASWILLWIIERRSRLAKRSTI